MNKSILLNDTSDYHNGCKIVTLSLEKRFGKFDKKFKTSDKGVLRIDFKQYDKVILNGEGTMHHDRGTARRLLSCLSAAQKAGCQTFLINTVWQAMSKGLIEIVKRCNFIETRECLSKELMVNQGAIENHIEVIPDASYFYEVPYDDRYDVVSIYQGQYIQFQGFRFPYPRINIFEQDWSEIVNRLRSSRLLITGRHHEMYAACVAKCPFIVYSGNTWKNEGLLKSANVNIPYFSKYSPPGEKVIKSVLDGEYDEEYEKLWRYLDGHHKHYQVVAEKP